MPAPVSQAQAALFGAIAGGQVKKKGFPADEARKRLEGVQVHKLPARKTKKRGIREAILGH
jgi:hypothetical protein